MRHPASLLNTVFSPAASVATLDSRRIFPSLSKMQYRLLLSPISMPIVYPSPSPALNFAAASASAFTSCSTSFCLAFRFAILFFAISNPATFRFVSRSCFLFPFPCFCVFVVLLISFFIADLLYLHLECCYPWELTASRSRRSAFSSHLRMPSRYHGKWMSKPLPRLRTNLDFMPSPVPDRPGLLMRDSYRYSDVTLIIPPVLVQCLHCFDGQTTELELRQDLVRITGDLQVGELQQNLVNTLAESGFLEDSTYERMREARHREFADEPRRQPSHAGSAYPDEFEPLREAMGAWMNGAVSNGSRPLMGIAAPHVSPEGGFKSYQAAYSALAPEYKDRTFVVLGTSHYGQPERFGMTRKPFVTPLGESAVDLPLVDTLTSAAPAAILMEDYCHSIEHSIEFQVLFLQHLFGPSIRILPILCGPFARSIQQGGKPESAGRVHRFFESLGELAAREQDRLLWVLGVDMAHM